MLDHTDQLTDQLTDQPKLSPQPVMPLVIPDECPAKTSAFELDTRSAAETRVNEVSPSNKNSKSEHTGHSIHVTPTSPRHLDPEYSHSLPAEQARDHNDQKRKSRRTVVFNKAFDQIHVIDDIEDLLAYVTRYRIELNKKIKEWLKSQKKFQELEEKIQSWKNQHMLEIAGLKNNDQQDIKDDIDKTVKELRRIYTEWRKAPILKLETEVENLHNAIYKLRSRLHNRQNYTDASRKNSWRKGSKTVLDNQKPHKSILKELKVRSLCKEFKMYANSPDCNVPDASKCELNNKAIELYIKFKLSPKFYTTIVLLLQVQNLADRLDVNSNSLLNLWQAESMQRKAADIRAKFNKLNFESFSNMQEHELFDTLSGIFSGKVTANEELKPFQELCETVKKSRNWYDPRQTKSAVLMGQAINNVLKDRRVPSDKPKLAQVLGSSNIANDSCVPSGNQPN